jgi:hypothetical protein
MPGDKDRNIHPHQPCAHTNRAAEAGAVHAWFGLVTLPVLLDFEHKYNPVAEKNLVVRYQFKQCNLD